MKKKHVRVILLALCVVVVASMMVSAMASSESMGEKVSAGFQTAASDTIDMMLAIVPIGLSVFVLVWGVKKAMGMLKASSGGGTGG